MFSQFRQIKVLVIGDLMLDTYTTGKVRRISPEAPVSVLHVQKEESRPGGAGNVALNLVSLGAQVIAIGRVGADVSGDLLRLSLEREGVNIDGVVTQSEFKTPVKNRLIADSQQILRVDSETVSPVSTELEEQIVDLLQQSIDQVQVIAVSDYGKGFLSRFLLKNLMELAKKKNIPVIVDPKGEEFSKYQGATILKPNLSEAYQAVKMPLETPIEQVAASLLRTCAVDMLLITRSELGISLFTREGDHLDFPVRSKEVKDVTGAGDTVLAMISVAMANGLDIRYAVQLANIAAGIAIERLGCARINLAEMAERLLEFDIENKIFDEEHLFALQQVLQGKRFSLLGLTTTCGMSTALFKTIRKIVARDPGKKLIIYVRDSEPDEEFVLLLSSLAEVDFIVLKCESLQDLCETIHPHEVYLMEGETLHALSGLEALLLSSC